MLRIKNYQFSPALVPSIAAGIVFPVLVSLGFWQLDRADEKRLIEEELQQAQQKAPLQINNSLDQDLIKQIYRPATANGYFDGQHQFLHDNKTHQGKPGYHVLTPFILKDTKTAILVNRGWIPYQGHRDKIQDIRIDVDIRDIEGAIKKPGKTILLNDEPQSSGIYPLTIQAIALETMATPLEYSFLPVMLELDKADQAGFTREWQPYYGSIGKHNGYAIQWFLMAAILLFLYIKINTKKIV